MSQLSPTRAAVELGTSLTVGVSVMGAKRKDA